MSHHLTYAEAVVAVTLPFVTGLIFSACGVPNA